MDSRLRDRIETIFHSARERAAGPEREAFLDGACGTEAELRSRVDALLAADADAVDFLDGPAVELEHERPGARIGPYRLLQEIGEGGMGVVYMAEQEKPVMRKVALKVIKLGMDTKQVVARFEAERQALALMDHPNIARVLDAGATGTGRPYFVMELVRGIAIHEYCDKHKLTTAERLRLFVDVCRAVQHAHQKGVIHRDLKPSNVLVTSHDGQPVPKIIDFGVSKATNRRLTERTLFTEFAQVVGTPEYMSPEQAEMSGLDVDTRSDIYALGVLLYQLLTGTTPVDPKALRTAGFEEMTRIIREEEAPAPSTRVSKLGADADSIAARRGSDAGALSRHLAGELDWIVLKALEKDRTRRYETAASFADDVVRHLEDRPVEAGPVSAAYRLRKFAHRNKKAVLAAALVLAAVALGLAGTTAGFLRARDEATRSAAIGASLQDVLAMSDAGRASDRGEVEAVLATVREVFGQEHATYAAVLDTLATRLRDAGDFETAIELSRESIDVWGRVHGERHRNVARARSHLGSLLRLVGDESGAERELRAAVEVLGDAAESHDARVELADILSSRGDYQEANELFGEALAILRASPSPAHYRILRTLEKRIVVQMTHTSADAIQTLRELYEEAREFYPDDSPVLASTAFGLGNQLAQQGHPEEAEPYLREAIERFRACDAQGIYLVVAHDALFQMYRLRTDSEGVAMANQLLRETIDVARDFWSLDSYFANLRGYAERSLAAGQCADAARALIEAHAAAVEAGLTVPEREDHRDALAQVTFAIVTRTGLERYDYEQSLAAIELALEDEPDHRAMRILRAIALVRVGELERAVRIFDALPAASGPGGGLERLVWPVGLAFRALAYGRTGDEERAREYLALFLGEVESGGLRERTLAREVEAELKQLLSE